MVLINKDSTELTEIDLTIKTEQELVVKTEQELAVKTEQELAVKTEQELTYPKPEIMDRENNINSLHTRENKKTCFCNSCRCCKRNSYSETRRKRSSSIDSDLDLFCLYLSLEYSNHHNIDCSCMAECLNIITICIGNSIECMGNSIECMGNGIECIGNGIACICNVISEIDCDD